MQTADEADYQQKIKAEADYWDREFIDQAIGDPFFHCFFHHSPYFERRLRAPYLAKIAALVKPGCSALDLGCGMGWLALRLAKMGASVRGVDVAERSLEQARHKAGRLGLANCVFDKMDANTEALPASAYDLVVAWGALHHLVRIDHVIAEVARSLKPGGVFVLSECVDREGPRARVANALADLFHMALPTDRSYGKKIAHAYAKLSKGKQAQEYEWSPFENVSGGSWMDAVLSRFEIVEHDETMSFMSPFAARLRLPEPFHAWTAGSLFALDKSLIRLRLLPAEYHFMILKKRGEV